MTGAFQASAFQNSAFQVDAPPEVSVGGSARISRPERVGWTIDDVPVALDWASASMVAPGGFEALSGCRVPYKDMPDGAGAYSIVQGVRSSGKVLYHGQIAATPRLRDDMAFFEAEGLAERIRRARGRLLYQHRGADGWVTRDAEVHAPASYQQNEHYDVQIKEGRMAFVVTADTYSTQKAGALFWAKGQLITRVAGTINKTGNLANFELRVYTSTGPTGADSLEATAYSLASGGPASFDHTLSVPCDQVHLVVAATAAATPARTRITLTDLRVNGIALGDTFTVKDAASDVFGRLVFDASKVAASSMNALPLDWTGDWPALLDHLALLDDGTWLVTEPPARSAYKASGFLGPWGQTWELSENHGADLDGLEPQTPYNAVVISYETTAGEAQELTVLADPDPYSGKGIMVAWPPDGPLAFPQPQQDEARVLAVGARLAAYVSGVRLRGSALIGRPLGPDGYAHPWDVRAGEMASMPGFRPRAPQQRIVRVTYSPNETTLAEIGEELDPDVLLARLL